MINQILFTFFRTRVYIFEHVSKESWIYYNTNLFINKNPNFKFDYQESVIMMVAYELIRRILVLCKIVLAFALISCINALIIRLIIKGSAILVYPILWL